MSGPDRKIIRLTSRRPRDEEPPVHHARRLRLHRLAPTAAGRGLVRSSVLQSPGKRESLCGGESWREAKCGTRVFRSMARIVAKLTAEESLKRMQEFTKRKGDSRLPLSEMARIEVYLPDVPRRIVAVGNQQAVQPRGRNNGHGSIHALAGTGEGDRPPGRSSPGHRLRRGGQDGGHLPPSCPRSSKRASSRPRSSPSPSPSGRPRPSRPASPSGLPRSRARRSSTGSAPCSSAPSTPTACTCSKIMCRSSATSTSSTRTVWPACSAGNTNGWN